MTIPSLTLALIIAAEGPDCGIRQPALDDVRERCGIAYTLAEVRQDRGKAIEVMRAYLELWVPVGQRHDTLLCMAVYRGGPGADPLNYWHYAEQGRRNLEQYRRSR